MMRRRDGVNGVQGVGGVCYFVSLLKLRGIVDMGGVQLSCTWLIHAPTEIIRDHYIPVG